ncbi:MAG: hypothetical protein FWH17_10630 [Oscillospiraceae bacterium]|nr:hypothetical protein [Oscillospiraceae bacterium]
MKIKKIIAILIAAALAAGLFAGCGVQGGNSDGNLSIRERSKPTPTPLTISDPTPPPTLEPTLPATPDPPPTATPGPTPPPTPDLIETPTPTGTELVGKWNQGSGIKIWYFEESVEIEFFTPNSDGIGLVYDSYGEWGEWYIDWDGILWISGEEYLDRYGIVALKFDVTGDTLYLTDTHADTRSYRRAG